MIKLENLHGDKGATQKRKRIGRGQGSGWGKQAGKGHKGEQARSGTPKAKGFEGGQTPLARRIPKRGFSNLPWAVPTSNVTLKQLNHFEDGSVVDYPVLYAAGVVGKNAKRIKVLATGELTKKLTVRADAFSAGAKAAIEKAGGVCEEVPLREASSEEVTSTED